MSKAKTINNKTFLGLNVNYREGSSDEKVLGHSFEKDIFYAAVPDISIRENSVIIDVGAHIGTFSLLSSKKVPSGKVIAIEACKETYDLLESNVNGNNLKNIIPYHLALSDKKGKTRLFYDRGNWGHSIMSPLSQEGEEVETDSLENILKSLKIEKVDFIKFNCEGAEFSIINSTPLSVLRNIKAMLILYHLYLVNHLNFSENTLITKLEEAGFFIKIIKRRKYRGWIIAKNKKHYNYFVHKAKEVFKKIKKKLG
jgi:FkbM family methyltransferase